jgi:hypothetical protein
VTDDRDDALHLDNAARPVTVHRVRCADCPDRTIAVRELTLSVDCACEKPCIACADDPGTHNPFAYHPHCRTCHSNGHNACEVCGACIRADSRIDARFGSNRCRQRAYRQRKAVRGAGR